MKIRILTALILIPLALLILFYLPVKSFLFLTAFIVLAGAYEWAQFMDITQKKYKFIYVALMAIALLIAAVIPIEVTLFISGIWWVIATLLILAYPRLSAFWGRSKSLRGLMGILLLISCWTAINAIRAQGMGVYALFYLFVLVWGADSSAYFVGKWCGKRKLAPTLSPGKTWEGVAGACVATLIITLIALYFSHTPQYVWVLCLLLSLVVTMFSIIGDLFESMMKRVVNLKDSGSIFPGHGGLLDRIDSLTAAAPVFALCLLFLSWWYAS